MLSFITKLTRSSPRFNVYTNNTCFLTFTLTLKHISCQHFVDQYLTYTTRRFCLTVRRSDGLWFSALGPQLALFSCSTNTKLRPRTHATCFPIINCLIAQGTILSYYFPISIYPISKLLSC